MAPGLQFCMVLWSTLLKPANSSRTRAVPQAWGGGEQLEDKMLHLPLTSQGSWGWQDNAQAVCCYGHWALLGRQSE